jgi:type IV pilus assembly protein PilP
MAAKKKTSITKKLITFGVLIIVLQAGILMYFRSQSAPVTISAAIDKEVKDIEDPRKREIRRIQLSVRSYQVQEGKLPQNLEQLVPLYLKKVPVDPYTNKPFEYQINGSQFSITGENMEAMTAAGPGKARPTAKRLEEKAEEALLASLNESPTDEQWVYDPTNKRDPFLPYDASVKEEGDADKTPLERFALSQLKLTAVLEGFSTPTAIVESAGGKGFTVRKGTKIGRNSGEIIEIRPDRLVILETEIDFSGEKKTRTVELTLRTKDREDKR